MQNRHSLNNSLGLLAKSSFLVLITVLSSKILTYLYKIIIARNYGAETYGVFILSLMIVGWLSIFAKMGFGDGLVRFIPLYRAKSENEKVLYLIRKSLLITGTLSILAGVILFLTSNFIALELFKNRELIIFLKIFSVAIPLVVLSSVYISILRAYEEIFWVAFIGNILQSIVNLIVILLLISVSAGSISVSVSYTIGMLAILIVSRVIVHKKVPLGLDSSKVQNKKDLFKEFKSYSSPLIFFGIIISLLHWTDSFMIGLLMNVREVGIYNAAAPIAFLIAVSIDLFRQLFLPLATKEYSKNNLENVRQLSKQVGKWVYMLSLPVFILLMVYPEFFINLLFGEEFLASANSLRILAIGAMFVSIFEISKETLSMEGKSKLILKDTAIAFLLNIILSFVLIQKLGINGAAIATTSSLVVLGSIFAFQAYKDLKVLPLRKKMLNLSLAGLAALVFLLGLDAIIPNTIAYKLLSFFGFLLVYSILVLIYCLDKNDKLILSLLKAKLSRQKQTHLNSAITPSKVHNSTQES